jgi:hypothetical protein
MNSITRARQQLIALRNKVGAETPIGSRCSLAIEQLQNAEKAETPQRREYLLCGLVATLAELAAIKNGAPADTQIRPGTHQP